MKRILLSLSAVLALSSCIQDELLDSPSPSDGDSAVTFESYLGRDAVTRATVEDATTLMAKGFGVMGWYTGQDDYAEDYASDVYDYDFMINTKVSNADGTGWSYSPLKYWPNNEGDKLTFLAYAPYDAAYSAVSGVASTALSQTVDFSVANEVKDQIDLLWSDNPENENMLKPDIDSRVLFTFKHALSRIGFKVAAFVDDVRTEDGSTSENLDAGTVINVKKVMLVNGTTTYNADNSVTPVGVFYTGGTLDLYNFTAADASETVPAAWDEKLPADVIDAQYFELTADGHFINTVTDGDGVNVFQLSGDDATTLQTLNAEDSYIMIIPQDFTNEFTDGYKVYIEYDVVTTGDNALGSSDASTVTNRILSDLALTTDFESGKAYTLNIYLGMTSVKFDVVVEDWVDGDPADTDEDLPANKDGESEGGVDDEILNAEGFAGAGTIDDPYRIKTVDQLLKMAELINADNSAYTHANYRQMNDLDLTGYDFNDMSSSLMNDFFGVYDGGGYDISNFISDNACSIFGNNNGTIKDVHLTGTDAQIINDGQGVLVTTNSGTMISCSYEGVFTGLSESYIGPLASSNTGVMIGCSFNGNYSGVNIYSGAVTAYNHGTLIGCYSSGIIEGASLSYQSIGGIANYSNVDSARVIGCYTTAEFTAKYDGCQIIPVCSMDSGIMTECYSSATSDLSFYADGSVVVDGTAISWESAAANMNTAIQEAGCSYKYVENTDDATKDVFPYVLVEIK